MDYIVLAHWIMGDGGKINEGVTLCKINYSTPQLFLLINILILTI
jgi:hypothetical protein